MQERLILVLYAPPHLCTAWLGSHEVNRHWWCYARHALVLHGPLALSIKALAVLPHRFDKTMLAWQECESVTTEGPWVWLQPTWLHTIWASEWPSFVRRLINQSKWVNMNEPGESMWDWLNIKSVTIGSIPRGKGCWCIFHIPGRCSWCNMNFSKARVVYSGESESRDALLK